MAEQDPDLAHVPLEVLEREQAKLASDEDRLARFTQFARFAPFPFQRPWYESRAETRVITAGNQTGKSCCGAIETISGCLGVRPLALGGAIPKRWPRDTRVGKRYIIGSESEDTIMRNIVPKLDQYIEPGMLAGRPHVKGTVPRFYRFLSGATITIMTYNQSAKVWEGDVADGYWFDEPPRQVVYNAACRGGMAREAWKLITATPIGPDAAWMKDALLIPAEDPEHDLYGKVETFSADMEQNCREHHGGALPHERIVTLLAQLDDPVERAAREFGIFCQDATLEFHYVKEETHVVPDFDAWRRWPIVEIVDPAMKRGLHVMWFAVSPRDEWYAVHAAHIENDAFSRMAQGIRLHRMRVGKPPDVMLMDRRGGAHTIDMERQQDWFEKFRQLGPDMTYAQAPDTHIQVLHDYLRPRWSPDTGDKEIPILRMTREVARMEKGPLWALRRFVWDPMASAKRKYAQLGKDWIDCMVYLAAAKLKYDKLINRSQRSADVGIAGSYARGDRRSPERSVAPWRRDQRVGLGASYASRAPTWVNKIPRGYS